MQLWCSKYHVHLLCKHLVQAAPKPPASWWPEAFRCHITPFYRVPGTSSCQISIPELQPYHWLARMPGYNPTNAPILPKTPVRRNTLGLLNNVSNICLCCLRYFLTLLTKEAMVNTSPAPYISSPTPPAAISGDDSLHNGLEDGFQVSHNFFLPFTGYLN